MFEMSQIVIDINNKRFFRTNDVAIECELFNSSHYRLKKQTEAFKEKNKIKMYSIQEHLRASLNKTFLSFITKKYQEHRAIKRREKS